SPVFYPSDAQHTMVSLAETIARWDYYVRPYLVHLPAPLATQVYSSGRAVFLSALSAELPQPVFPDEQHACTLWGIGFRCRILNAAGMFKNGEGYELSWRHGAGAYLAGTTTTYARQGNRKHGINKPFIPYPRSQAASNWLGLPNDGHAAVAQRLAAFRRYENFPIGASLMTAPESQGITALDELLEGLKVYDAARVDFIEINESCPNVAHDTSSMEELTQRLEYISQRFLRVRTRNLPVVVKFSNDTALTDVEHLLDILLTLRYDGINFGNTSTQYDQHRALLDASELRIFDYFTQTFGGGISGKPLRASSLALIRRAHEILSSKNPQHEFHIIQTGGVDSGQNIHESLAAGASLCQWYTGYFERFAEHGHRLYEHVLSELSVLYDA
ncbi:MAG: hypothetical protein RML40_10515, partial [Bacteroidota bacterium]|nr:hypothetical protein [Candidatus Kapabacteria bacterium]MDW8220946.1 hypothetical protein [Bacteroidota bacterium]